MASLSTGQGFSGFGVGLQLSFFRILQIALITVLGDRELRLWPVQHSQAARANGREILNVCHLFLQNLAEGNQSFLVFVDYRVRQLEWSKQCISKLRWCVATSLGALFHLWTKGICLSGSVSEWAQSPFVCQIFQQACVVIDRMHHSRVHPGRN